MSRLPYLRRDQLTADGQALWDALAGTGRSEVMTEQGELAGPINAFLHAPELGRDLTRLALTLLAGTSIERRLTEVAIITVGARWQAEFEWWAHARMARDNGVPDAVVDAIGRGADPPFTAEDERIVHAVAYQLAQTGQVTEDAYAAGRELVGHTGMVELVTLCGYYTLISFLLNAFSVPIPAGAVPTWSGEPDAA
jgi:4-carboxymuconolactone decarboxylase